MVDWAFAAQRTRSKGLQAALTGLSSDFACYAASPRSVTPDLVPQSDPNVIPGSYLDCLINGYADATLPGLAAFHATMQRNMTT